MLCLLSYPASDYLRVAAEGPGRRCQGLWAWSFRLGALQAGNFVSEALCLGFNNIHHENMKVRPWLALKTLRF
jgi:hypothetical protein